MTKAQFILRNVPHVAYKVPGTDRWVSELSRPMLKEVNELIAYVLDLAGQKADTDSGDMIDSIGDKIRQLHVD